MSSDRNEPPFNSAEHAVPRGDVDGCAACALEPHYQHDDGQTIDVGYVHVLTDDRSACRPDCPHPDHE